MAYVLDFNARKKEYMTLVLPDEKKTRLMIGIPTKAHINELAVLAEQIEKLTGNETDSIVFDDIYTVCAKVMSNNKTGTKITKKHLESCCDVEDIFTFYYSYLDFVSTVANSKN